MSGSKSLKQYAKEAKARIKSGFWQDYKNNVKTGTLSVENTESTSKVVKYYQQKASITIKGVEQSEEEFYLQVKNLLDTYGDVSDAIGRLTDRAYFETLSYEQRSRYTLEISQRYLKAKERYYKELKFEKLM